MANKDAVITEVRREGMKWVVKGRVKSKSRPGLWHEVSITIKWIDGEIDVRGSCDCEAFTKGHMLCRHILHLANVFIRNRGKMTNPSYN